MSAKFIEADEQALRHPASAQPRTSDGATDVMLGDWRQLPMWGCPLSCVDQRNNRPHSGQCIRSLLCVHQQELQLNFVPARHTAR